METDLQEFIKQFYICVEVPSPSALILHHTNLSAILTLDQPNMASYDAIKDAATVVAVPEKKDNTATRFNECTPDHTESGEKLRSNADEASSKNTAVETLMGDDGHMEDVNGSQTIVARKSFGFYAIIAALALSGMLTSLEATITSTALPTITADLGGGDLFIWVVNGFYLTQ